MCQNWDFCGCPRCPNPFYTDSRQDTPFNGYHNMNIYNIDKDFLPDNHSGRRPRKVCRGRLVVDSSDENRSPTLDSVRTGRWRCYTVRHNLLAQMYISVRRCRLRRKALFRCWREWRRNPTLLIRDVLMDGIATNGHIGATAYAFAEWWLLRNDRTIRFGKLVKVLLKGRKACGPCRGKHLRRMVGLM